MPNWCENELKISGKELDVSSLLEAVRSDRLGDEEPDLIDFNKVIPYPQEYREKDKIAQEARDQWHALPEDSRPPYSEVVPRDGYNQGGYEWCSRSWGTKWNACDISLLKDEIKNGRRNVLLYFTTAWSPPEPIVRELADKFPTLNLQLKYWEGGCGFKGVLEFRKGECVKDQHDNQYRGHRGG